MKIDVNLSGRRAGARDYAELRDALLAAQAATPTARVTRELREPLPPRDALEQLLADGAQADDVASSLDHRFAPDVNTSETRDE